MTPATHANPFGELADPDSLLVRDALTRRCEVCKAKPGRECTNTVTAQTELRGRLVHYARTAT
jgi:hypothetical protein